MNTHTHTHAAPTISALAHALRRGAASATELAEQTLRRIRHSDPALNAFALVDEDGARKAARTADEEIAAGIDRGPLHGVPVAVKDLIDMAGLPTTCGSATSFGATAAAGDAEIVERLRACGAVIVGKTTLHEFAYGATGDRSVHGASRNPHDPGRISGGSSGGSAVAVAAGMVPLSVGTDTAGSVRVPAALCGVVGLKPAYDALPTRGVHPLAPTLDHVGLFARTVRDAALADAAMTGARGAARSPRLPRSSSGWLPPSPSARSTRASTPRCGGRCAGRYPRSRNWVLDPPRGGDVRRVLHRSSPARPSPCTPTPSSRAPGLIDGEVLERLERRAPGSPPGGTSGPSTAVDPCRPDGRPLRTGRRPRAADRADGRHRGRRAYAARSTASAPRSARRCSR